MAKLWQKSGKKLHPLVEKYTVATDPIFDMEFLRYDIAASRAHVMGLKKVGILNRSEVAKIFRGLGALLKEVELGKVTINAEDEDCYTVIENYLVKKIGIVGKKVHTGRSRNEVVTMVRLYMNDHLVRLHSGCVSLARYFVDLAEKYKEIPMAGYSHTQQAMLSTVGHYFAAHAESLLDDADFIAATLKHLDKSPLGSAAGFGTSIGIDRSYTAKELGFSDVQINTLYCHTSRGKFESAYMEALVQIMLTLGKFANDMVLFTSQEFDFFAVDDSLVTGSSIMPHKRNLDVMEILRGNVSVVIANQLLIKDTTKNLISGYNRDGQLIKKPLVESTYIVADSIAIVGLLLKGLTPKPENIRAKVSNGIFTADIANELVKNGTPFRDAYMQAASKLVGDVDLVANIASKRSIGAPGNLQLKAYRKRIKAMRI